MQFLILLLSLLASSLFSFGNITAQNAATAGYTSIPQATRDYYSKEILFLAQPRCKFLQFAKVRNDLQAIKGKSIVFNKYANLAGGGSLAEDDPLKPQTISASEIQITVSEQANAIQLTELLLRTSMYDVLGDASKLLSNNLAVVLDIQFRDAVLATTNVKYGNGVAGITSIDNTAVFNTKTIKDCVELLATNNAPKFLNEQGDFYVCFAHPSALRQLRDDSAWISANTYMGRRQLYVGEAGMYEGVIFIETTQMPKLTAAQINTKYGALPTATNVCESVVFGENAYAWAVALPVEMRDDGIVDIGRKHTIAWYGIWGMGIIEGKNIVRVLSGTAN